MTSADLLRSAMERAGVSAPQLARLAGVGRSTLYRYLEGRQDPGMATVDTLLAPLGLTARLSVEPLSDPLAADALVTLLQRVQHELTEDESPWAERLARATAVSPTRALHLVGAVASVLRRPDAVGLAAPDWSIDRLVSAGISSRERWALSGWAALDAMGHDVDTATIFWTGTPRTIVQLLADTFTTVPLDRADVIVCTAHDSTFQEATSIEDVHLVSPTRAWVDALGLGGEAGDLAFSVLQGELGDR